MAQYINKAAVLAEIQKRFDEYSSSVLKHYDACKEAKAQELGKILIIINTLEVKDVDFEKEWKVEQLTTFAQHLNKRGAFRDDLCMDFEHEAQSFIESQNNKEL